MNHPDRRRNGAESSPVVSAFEKAESGGPCELPHPSQLGRRTPQAHRDQGVDITLDVAGGDGINRSVLATKAGGKIAQIGFLGRFREAGDQGLLIWNSSARGTLFPRLSANLDWPGYAISASSHKQTKTAAWDYFRHSSRFRSRIILAAQSR